MSNKETYKRKHKYLDKQITHLEKTNYYNRTLIANLKKKKLKSKLHLFAFFEKCKSFVSIKKTKKKTFLMGEITYIFADTASTTKTQK